MGTTWLHQSLPPLVSTGFAFPASTLAWWGKVLQPTACVGFDIPGSGATTGAQVMELPVAPGMWVWQLLINP